MTQLIENKPPRPALIATLLHFSPSPVWGVPDFRGPVDPIGVPKPDRWTPPESLHRSRCVLQPPASSLQHPEPNRRKSAIFSSPQNCVHRLALMQRSKEGPLAAASNLQLLASSLKNLIDTASRLEINLTSAESTQTPLLIVAESRVLRPAFCAEKRKFVGTRARRLQNIRSASWRERATPQAPPFSDPRSRAGRENGPCWKFVARFEPLLCRTLSGHIRRDRVLECRSQKD